MMTLYDRACLEREAQELGLEPDALLQAARPPLPPYSATAKHTSAYWAARLEPARQRAESGMLRRLGGWVLAFLALAVARWLCGGRG